MKAGSTTLYRQLSGHPQLFLTQPKEPQYFSRRYGDPEAEGWYRGLFEDSDPGQLRGEASSCYSRWPHFGDVAARIARDAPHTRLIYLMRDPVDRAYSHYRHVMNERQLDGTGPIITFDEAIEAIPEIIDASLYTVQIEQYLQHFQRGRLLLLTLDDLQTDPGRTLAHVQHFLGIDERDLARGHKLIANRSGDVIARRQIARLLRRARSVPGANFVVGALPPSLRQRLRRRVRRSVTLVRLLSGAQGFESQEFSPLSRETRASLVERFEKPTRELERFLGRDLSEWRS